MCVSRGSTTSRLLSPPKNATMNIACGGMQCDSVLRSEHACARVYDEFASNKLCLPGTLTIICSVYLVYFGKFSLAEKGKFAYTCT